MKKRNNPLNTLFKVETWKSKKALWIAIPLLLWIIGMISYWYVTTSIKAKQQIKKASFAINLQEDINFISTKAQSAQILPSLNKEELLKSDKEDNFLEKKIKRNLERADYAKSMGTKDDIPIRFDTALNASVYREATDNLAAGQDQPIQQLPATTSISSMPDTQATNVAIQQALDKIRAGDPNSMGRTSSYEAMERDRKDRLAAATAANRQRRLAIEHSTLDEEVAAYRRGLADQERRYAALEGEPDYGEVPRSNQKNRYQKSSSKSHNKRKKQKLQFDTNTGIRDKLYQEKTVTANNENYKSANRQRSNHTNPYSTATNIPPQVLPVNYTPTNQPLYAIIDRAQKLQSGDKVRLRLVENGIYKGQLLLANQLFYGICSVGSGRIKIRVSSITIQQQLLPAALEVYDLDGMQGIYIEGSDIDIGREALREGLREASGLGIRNPLGNLSLRLGRRASKNISARIPSGYQVMLFDRNIQ